MERGWGTGALSPVDAALSSLDVFKTMGALGIVWLPITFHIVFLSLETIAALCPDPAARPE
jgi:hypothetical protein